MLSSFQGCTILTPNRSDAERRKYTDDMPGLQRTRALARRQLREAKEHRRRKGSDWRRKADAEGSAQIPTPNIRPGTVRPDDDGDGDEPLVYENLDELEREFETWKLEENERQAQEEAEKRAVQEDAVRSWKLQQSQEIESSRQKIEDARSSLRAELTTRHIAPQQIEEIVDHVHPRIDFRSELHVLSRASASDKAVSVVPGSDSGEATPARWWSIWSRK